MPVSEDIDYEQISSRLSHDAIALCRHISLFSEMARDSDDPADRCDEISYKAQRVAAKIRAARRFAYIEAHKPTMERVDIAELCEKLLRQNAIELGSREISLTGTGESWTDPVYLTTAIQSLVENIVAHSPAGSPVRIEVSKNHVVVSSLSDRPATEDDLAPFTSTLQDREGLGLALAARAIRLAGGSLLPQEAAASYAMAIRLPDQNAQDK